VDSPGWSGSCDDPNRYKSSGPRSKSIGKSETLAKIRQVTSSDHRHVDARPDARLTLFRLNIGHIERLGDGREERSKGKLVNDMREVHDWASPVRWSSAIDQKRASRRPSAILTMMTRMLPTHVSMPQGRDMQIPRDPLDTHTPVDPTGRPGVRPVDRSPNLGLSEPRGRPSRFVLGARGTSVRSVRVNWSRTGPAVQEPGEESTESRAGRGLSGRFG